MLGARATRCWRKGCTTAAFLARYCVGFERFVPYLIGDADGQPKDAAWAAAICGIDAETIRALARRMAASRTMITVAWSLQRADHGEQPLLGGGDARRDARPDRPARRRLRLRLRRRATAIGRAAAPSCASPRCGQGENAPIDSYIPVARIADMLLRPGRAFDYDGRRMHAARHPARLLGGGNPFHHHQDLNRLVRGLADGPRRWSCTSRAGTPLARHADIVLPATTTLERNDIGVAARRGASSFAMHQAIEPVGEARNDHDILTGIAGRLGFEAAFTEGRDEMEWLRQLYDALAPDAARRGGSSCRRSRRSGSRAIVRAAGAGRGRRFLLEAFRADPAGAPAGHAVGQDRDLLRARSPASATTTARPSGLARAGRMARRAGGRSAIPLHLISNQPRTRLHSQLDNGADQPRRQGRGPRADLRSIRTTRPRAGSPRATWCACSTTRGACLAGAVVTDAVSPACRAIADRRLVRPARAGRAGHARPVHGNPNMLTPRQGHLAASAQGPSAHSCWSRSSAARATRRRSASSTPLRP